MKKSISYWSFPGGLDGSKPVAEAFNEAKAAGFEAVEVCLSVTGDVSLASTDADLARVRKAAQDIGIGIAGVACGLYWQWSLTSDDAVTRSKAMDISRKLLAAANRLGTDAVLVVPGAVDVPWDPSIPVVKYADAYERAAEAIRKLIPDARAAGVTIGVENVWNKLLLGPMEMASFIDQFDSPHVAAYFDVGNCVFIGYPEQWIEILGTRIKRVHFKDFRRSVGTGGGFVDLLAGDVNWPEVIRALKSVGYDGPVTAEMIPTYTHYPEVLIENTSRAMDRILGR
jgi:hexulose-6-phosphate isomerase